MLATPSWVPSNMTPQTVVPMPSRLGVVVDELADDLAGAVDGVGDDVQHLLAGEAAVGGLQLADGDGGGQVAGRGTAHAVGHHQHGGRDVGRVLVVLADQPDLGVRDVAQRQRHLLLHAHQGAADAQGVAGAERGRVR